MGEKNNKNQRRMRCHVSPLTTSNLRESMTLGSLVDQRYASLQKDRFDQAQIKSFETIFRLDEVKT